MHIDVKYPILFLLMIPVIFVLILFYRKSNRINSLEKKWIVLLRAFIFSLLIFALTLPEMLLPIKGENVIFLVDRSASMKGSEEQILTWINKSVQSKNKMDSYAIVSTGNHAAVEQSLTKTGDPIQEFSTQVGGDNTNIEQGIQLASALIPNHQKGRIILFSDGNETNGKAIEAAKLLKHQNIELDYVDVSGESGSDVALTEFKAPASLYQGEKAQLKLIANSTTNKAATVRISLNNREIMKKQVEVNKGENEFTFSHEVDETGMFVYKAEIIADDEAYLENNELFAVSNVKGIPKALIVQGEGNEQLSNILRSSNIQVDLLTAKQLPTTLSGYLPYQSIIFDNVDATSIGEKQMKIIEKAVKEFGVGFVMTGGENSFGLGGYFKTPIEKLLPVTMDIKGKKKMPTLGLVIVMDRSGSMSGQKLSLAKEAAARSVELMREEDTLGFIAFDDRPWVIVETEPIRDKKKVMKKIRSVTEGGGTEIYTSLKMAYDELMPLKLQRKHIILLTDGQSSNADYETLIEEGKKENITISTVALGQDADIRLLESLAEYGSGRFYNVTDSTVIPSILSRETVMASRTYIEDNPFYPVIQPYPDWLKHFKNGVPQMNAYIAVTPKQTAQVSVLSEKEDPILAEWQYGLGKTIAYTSDTSGKWAGDWARWNQWPNFWSHLVTKTFPSYENIPYDIRVTEENGKTLLQLKSNEAAILPLEAVVVSQSGNEMNVQTKMVAPGEYELKMEDTPGMYFLMVKQHTGEETEQAFQTGFTIPYSKEYLLKEVNQPFLKDLAGVVNGKELENEQAAFSPTIGESYHRRPIAEWLLLTAFLVFFIEIALRRFGFQPLIKLKNRNVKDKQETTVNPIQTLINTKKQKSKPKIVLNRRTEEKQTEKRHKEKKEEKPYPKTEGSDQEDRMQRLLNAKKGKRR
ncbi:VWA domain-containing protein [Heyndrickxia oleronia]|uniref:VWA domain-containing protein n=1 Tax=Heyndrickxia oleronia TaxID=38875 RepID=UPI001C0EC94A|nr:VWA domain-containing protein [Heyndrickxia oleronia]MBU5214404.1 VWA domain-containing protein [Heyndrickxia oleronia]